jgi:hypothetical protein
MCLRDENGVLLSSWAEIPFGQIVRLHSNKGMEREEDKVEQPKAAVREALPIKAERELPIKAFMPTGSVTVAFPGLKTSVTFQFEGPKSKRWAIFTAFEKIRANHANFTWDELYDKYDIVDNEIINVNSF